MAYVTAAQLLATLGVTPDAQKTSDATAAVNAATNAIDELCQRKNTTSRDGFGIDADASQVRYYSPVALDHLDIDDLVTLTSLVTRDDGGNVDTSDSGLQTWTANTDFVTTPMNAASQGWPYTRLETLPTGHYTFNTFYPRSVKVTGKFGWPSVPAAVVDACTLLSERLYKMKREAPLGVLAMAEVAVRVGTGDQNLRILLGPYTAHRGSVA